MFFGGHVANLIELIRTAAIKLYFDPYDSVRFETMATALAMEETEISKRVEAMIRTGDLKARIDTHARVVYSRADNERASTLREMREHTDSFVQSARAVVLFSDLLREDVVLK
jgi:COP9 signalosome complex subunit 1